jgi:hypothetical protein
LIASEEPTSSRGGAKAACAAAETTGRASIRCATTKQTTSCAGCWSSGRTSKETTSSWLVLTEQTATSSIVRGSESAAGALTKGRGGVVVGATAEKTSACIGIRVCTKA